MNNNELGGIEKFWIFIGILFGIAVGVFLAIFFYFNLMNLKPIKGDAISIANTYIVFISIIFILFTIAITIDGYIFAKIFTIEKKREIHQNIVIISNQLKHDKETRDVFIDELLNNSAIIDKITEKFLEIADKIKDERFHTLAKEDKINELTSLIKEEKQ